MEQRQFGDSVALGGAGIEASVDIFGNTQISDFILRQTLAGRVFIAGHGIEATITDGEAALDDTTPTYCLRGPMGGRIAIPLWVRLKLSTEGGAAPDIYMSYVDTGGTEISASGGTELTTLCTLGGAGIANSAKCKTGVTLGAITSAQNVNLFEATNLLDNLISTEGATTVIGVDSVNGRMTSYELPLYPTIPLALVNGSMLNVWAATGTTDSKWAFTMCWTEIDIKAAPDAQ